MNASSMGESSETGSSGQGIPPLETLVEEFAPVAAELERVSDELIDQITTAIREEIPSYQPIAYSGLRDAVSVPVRRGLEAAKGKATPTGSDLEEAAVIGREAASFGIPAEGLLQAIRVGVRIFWTKCIESARARDIDPRTLIAAADLIWRWSDDIGLALVRGHRDVALEKAVQVQHDRFTFLLGALQGSLGGQDLRDGAELHGLALEREYVPLRARAFSAARSPAHCERAIRHAFGPATEGVLVCRVDGDLIGVVPDRPTIDDPEVLIGLGPAAPLERIAPSYREAQRALETAARFGLRGAFQLADLALLAPIATEASLGERLVARYLTPFRDGSHAGEQLERTLRAYLEHDQRGEPAAKALQVHTNTFRNRMQKIEKMLGADFRNPARLAELWWALQYDSIAANAKASTQPPAASPEADDEERR